MEYAELIRSNAAMQGIEPAQAAAVILAESGYDPMAISNVNAQGLMQIMPDTGKWLAGKFDEEYVEGCLFDPATNIRYGCWYIGYLSKIFNGDPIKIACAYHAGPNNVKLWAMKYAADGVHLTINDIPMEDTQYYAGKVMNAYAIYFQHYYQDEG